MSVAEEEPLSIAPVEAEAVAITEAAVAQRTREQAVANALSAPANQADPSYEREWKKYKQYVAENVISGQLVSGGKFLTRTNVDAYFNEIIVNRTFAPASARRVVSALQWFADREEHANGEDAFSVDSTSVKGALKTHGRMYSERVVHQDAVDPHANLPTDMLSGEQIRSVLTMALDQSNWKDFSTCWNICENSFLRCDSMLKLRLCDLNIDYTHGPVESGPNAPMLSMILQKMAHKDRSSRIRVCGMWRSRDYLRCATGMLAFNTFFTYYNDTSLHFFRSATPNAKPDWQLRKILTGWSNRNAVASAYDAIYKALGLSWYKCTHLRTMGIEHASVAGLNNDELGTLSKHITDKIDRYTTELYPPVLKVMARFSKEEEYWVPRLSLGLPSDFTHNDLVKCLWPRIDEWREQQRSTYGDFPCDGCAASNFLWKVLPFFAMVIFQDGIYWLRDFPNNEATRLLAHIMPTWYPEWAADARDKVEEMIQHREDSKITTLNTAVQAAFTALANKMDAGEERLNTRIEAMANNLQLQIAGLGQRGVAQHAAQHNEEQEEPSLVAIVGMEAAPSRISLSPVTTASTLPPMVQVPPSQLSEWPYFPTPLPKSMEALWQEHCIYKLDAWAGKGISKKHWPDAVKMGFSRRMFFYRKIYEQASRFRNETEDFHTGKMPRAAAELDKMRAGRSMPKFGDALRTLNPLFKPREKRKLQA
jgi:Centromere DNA-binding protein complex CBF3 subunit, domain 2